MPVQARQKNGNDVLKVILKPTQRFPEGYFYCDASDEELVRSYTWRLMTQKHPYVRADSYQTLRFHREKAHNILDYYPDYINHINLNSAKKYNEANDFRLNLP